MKLGRAPTTKQTWCEGINFVVWRRGSARANQRPPPLAEAKICLYGLANAC
jgi:hypothetical protein